MHKWPVFVALSLAGLCLQAPAFAADGNTLPLGGALVCTPLIQQGESIPAAATTHLDTLKLCMDNCDTLYQTLGDLGHTEAMLKSINNCHKSLNNVYFASTAQIITDQLNQDTQQKQTADNQSAFERLSAMMLMKQQQQAQAQPEATAAQPPVDTHSNTQAPPQTPAAPANQSSSGSSDAINW